MAKSIGSGPLGAIFTSVTPKSEDKKRAKKSKGEKSVTEPEQQHGGLSNDKEPTPVQKMKGHAKDAMQNATRDWVEGRMSTKDHNAVHARAAHVLKNKHPKEFAGQSGERKIKW
jgi:hypothetical protein